LPICFHQVKPGERAGSGPCIWAPTEKAQEYLLPAFALYEARTGRRIDLYGYTPFPPGTLAPLIQAGRDSLRDASSTEAAVAITEFVAALASINQSGVDAVIVGD
jgi:hypothetical protein